MRPMKVRRSRRSAKRASRPSIPIRPIICVSIYLIYDLFKDEDEGDDETDDSPKKSIGQEGIPPVDPNAGTGAGGDLRLEDAPADVDVLLQESQPEKSSMATGKLGVK